MNQEITTFGDRLVNWTVIIGLVIAIAILGCTREVSAQELSGSQYDRNEVRTLQTAKVGVVKASRPVTITVEAPTESRVVGGVVGAVAAGLLGRNIDGGAKYVLATLGGVGGEYVARNVGREVRAATEYIVTMASGVTIAVTQANDSTYIGVGETVALLEGRQARIVPLK